MQNMVMFWPPFSSQICCRPVTSFGPQSRNISLTPRRFEPPDVQQSIDLPTNLIQLAQFVIIWTFSQCIFVGCLLISAITFSENFIKTKSASHQSHPITSNRRLGIDAVKHTLIPDARIGHQANLAADVGLTCHDGWSFFPWTKWAKSTGKKTRTLWKGDWFSIWM